RIDPRLVLGSLAFGAGWGLAGFCPGPALVSLAAGVQKAFLFVVSMLVGMALFEIIERRLGKQF
ncbi:MAG: YeeE/YedE family protein, partial [Gammaproteobacteria bacterium]|nr:YeeE/YedE family protein [Gammaproteobacteria bacterium]